MASFQKRNKTWQYQVSRMVNGEQKPIRKGGFRTKKEAQVAAAQIEADLHKGINPFLTPEPFVNYFEGWVKIYKTDISNFTKKRYKDSLRAIESYFGYRPIQNIKKREYQDFLNTFAKTWAKETTRKLHNHIRACVREAIDEGLVRVDFTRDAVVTGNNQPKRPEEKHLNYTDSCKLMKGLYKRLDRSLSFYLLLLALTSGMRFGELVGLTRDDFDFKNNLLHVKRTWDYKEGSGFSTTKNNSSERVILIDQDTMNVFKDLFEETPPNLHDLVFFSPYNKSNVLTNAAVNKSLRIILDELGIRHITVHGLRHTHASILLYKGISIYFVSERLGHRTIDTTMRHYAHVLNELRAKDTLNTVMTFTEMKKGLG